MAPPLIQMDPCAEVGDTFTMNGCMNGGIDVPLYL